MKRIIFLALIAFAVTAVSAQSYIVQSVSGRIQMEAGGSRVDVAVGDILTVETKLHVGIGASMVLKDGDRTFTISSAQNGISVADLMASGSRVRIGGNVATVNTDAVERTTPQVSTASARASDAAEDLDEEE